MKNLAESNFDDEFTTKFNALHLEEKIPQLPCYDQLFGPLLAKKPELEMKHLDLVTKIREWPVIGVDTVNTFNMIHSKNNAFR